jgi:hypothetical protein
LAFFPVLSVYRAKKHTVNAMAGLTNEAYRNAANESLENVSGFTIGYIGRIVTNKKLHLREN